MIGELSELIPWPQIQIVQHNSMVHINFVCNGQLKVHINFGNVIHLMSKLVYFGPRSLLGGSMDRSWILHVYVYYIQALQNTFIAANAVYFN